MDTLRAGTGTEVRENQDSGIPSNRTGFLCGQEDTQHLSHCFSDAEEPTQSTRVSQGAAKHQTGKYRNIRKYNEGTLNSTDVGQRSQSGSSASFYICVNSPVDTVIGPLDLQDRTEVESLLNQHSDTEGDMRGKSSSGPSPVLTDVDICARDRLSDHDGSRSSPLGMDPLYPPIWCCDLGKVLADFRQRGIKYAVQHISKETGRCYWDMPQIVPPSPGTGSAGGDNSQVMWISRVQVVEFASMGMTYSRTKSQRPDDLADSDESSDIDVLRFKDYSKWRDELVVDTWYEVDGLAYRQGLPSAATQETSCGPGAERAEGIASVEKSTAGDRASAQGHPEGLVAYPLSPSQDQESHMDVLEADGDELKYNATHQFWPYTPDMDEDDGFRGICHLPFHHGTFRKQLYKSRSRHYTRPLFLRRRTRRITNTIKNFFYYLRMCLPARRLPVITFIAATSSDESPMLTTDVPITYSPILLFPGAWPEVVVHAAPMRMWPLHMASPMPRIPGAWLEVPELDDLVL